MKIAVAVVAALVISVAHAGDTAGYQYVLRYRDDPVNVSPDPLNCMISEMSPSDTFGTGTGQFSRPTAYRKGPVPPDMVNDLIEVLQALMPTDRESVLKLDECLKVMNVQPFESIINEE